MAVGMKTVIEGRWIYEGNRVVADEGCRQIEALLPKLILIGSRDGGWTRLYRDVPGTVFGN